MLDSVRIPVPSRAVVLIPLLVLRASIYHIPSLVGRFLPLWVDPARIRTVRMLHNVVCVAFS